MSGGIERFLLSGTAAWESSTRTGAHEAGLGGIMKHDLVINGIVIEDLEASRDYPTAKELVLEYLRQAAGQGKDTPTVFTQGTAGPSLSFGARWPPLRLALRAKTLVKPPTSTS